MKLKSQYAMLNPAELKRKMGKLQNELLRLNFLKQKMSEDNKIEKEFFVYISTWGSVFPSFMFLREAIGFQNYHNAIILSVDYSPCLIWRIIS